MAIFNDLKQVLGMKNSEEVEKNQKIEEREEIRIENEEIEELEELEIEEEVKFEEEQREGVFTTEKGETYENDEMHDYHSIVVKPVAFEEGKKIANYINNEKIVTINLEEVSNETGQRLLDFLSGAMEVKKAKFVAVNKKVYMSVPDGINSCEG